MSTHKRPSDDDLLRAARDGSEDAVAELMRRGWHLSMIERYTKPRPDKQEW